MYPKMTVRHQLVYFARLAGLSAGEAATAAADVDGAGRRGGPRQRRGAGPVERQPAAGATGDRARARAQPAHSRRAVLGPRPDGGREHEGHPPRAVGAGPVGAVQQPPARPRERHQPPRRHRRPRPDRARRRRARAARAGRVPVRVRDVRGADAVATDVRPCPRGRALRAVRPAATTCRHRSCDGARRRRPVRAGRRVHVHAARPVGGVPRLGRPDRRRWTRSRPWTWRRDRRRCGQAGRVRARSVSACVPAPSPCSPRCCASGSSPSGSSTRF